MFLEDKTKIAHTAHRDYLGCGPATIQVIKKL
jgi:hypothetical protein